MTAPTSSRTACFATIEALLDQALDRPPAKREAWLRQACSDDAIRCEVLALLRAADASEGFLEPEASVPERGGQRIDAWRLLRLLGRGGMGEVWLAERCDGRFEQQVAIKLLDGQGADKTWLLREQRLLARLEHPGIARLLDAGNLGDGQPYMVMEFIDGQPLLAYCAERQASVRRRLELFLEVCAAVAFAHRHLIVHRDLKPENILVRPDGRIALLDFGIARLLGGPAAGDAGVRHLTPRYAAPEQIAGAAATTLTDVYALGLLLHELLTGQSPWGVLSPSASLALMQRQDTTPLQPSSQAGPVPARSLRGDLDAIVDLALQEEPGARYGSVDALAADVHRHLTGKPVRARGRAPLYRSLRVLRRHWLAAGTLTALFMVMAAAVVLVTLARNDTLAALARAQLEVNRTQAVRDYLGYMFRDAGQSAGGGEMLSAREVLERAASRVESRFVDAPGLNAEVLQALGELYFHIGDYAGAEPLLRRWLAHEAEIGDAAAAADVRFTLAETVHRMGAADEARRLLAAAQEYWEHDPARHGDTLLTSRALQARLLREAGAVDQALSLLEAARSERLARSGRRHFETATLYTNLGAAYAAAGRLEEGIATSREALELWRLLGLDAGNDALNTLNNLGALEFRKGDYPAAERSFAEALALREAMFGPSAATAALLGNHARALQRLGRYTEGLAVAENAARMAEAHAGPASLHAQAAQITRTELLLQLGRNAEADDVLARYALHATASAPVPLQLRAALANAESALRRDDPVMTREHLGHATALATSPGPETIRAQQRIKALRQQLATLER